MDYIAINKKAWNQRTKTHIKSEFYDVEAFKKGKSSLNPIELGLVGDVKDKKILHLQCHFGQDTLSMARLGAHVTGVDLSVEAINQANALKSELGLKANFIASDVYQFGQENTEKFDLVYTSYGVLCWLPDLDQWAKVVADSLVNGGQFHIVEFHPYNDILTGYSYFPQSQPDVEEEGTYTENCDGTKSNVVTWPHSISEVINSLINAGLLIDEFTEYKYSPYDCFEGLESVENKGYQFLYKGQQVPLVYSISAIKEV